MVMMAMMIIKMMLVLMLTMIVVVIVVILVVMVQVRVAWLRMVIAKGGLASIEITFLAKLHNQ